MAVHVSHAALPYPIKGARYTIGIPTVASTTGIPTDPGTPDSEFSVDGGAFADCAEEVTTITGSNGMSYLTLTGAETNGSIIGVALKALTGSTTSQMWLYPRALPAMLSAVTANAGAAGYIEMPAAATTVPAIYDGGGLIVMTTGGTGGGGTGGANNQARVVTSVTLSGGRYRLNVTPNWETTPDNTTTFNIYLTEVWKGGFNLYSRPHLWGGLLSAVADTTVTLPAGHGLDHEGNYLIVVNTGTNAVGKGRYLTYSGSGEVWTVDPAFNSDAETTPTGTVVATVYAAPKIPTSSLPRVDLRTVAGTAQTALDLGAALAVPVTPGALPSFSSSTLSQWVAWLALRSGMGKRTFNKSTGVETQRNAADNTSLGTATHADDGTTVTKNKLA